MSFCPKDSGRNRATDIGEKFTDRHLANENAIDVSHMGLTIVIFNCNIPILYTALGAIVCPTRRYVR